MFTQTEDLYVFYHHQLVMVLVEDGLVDQVSDVLLISFGEEEHGLRIPLRRAEKTLTLRIFSDAFQYRFHCALEFLKSGVGFGWGGLKTFPGPNT